MKTAAYLSAAMVSLAWVLSTAAGADDAWVAPMKKVHAKFTGQAGTVAQIGDSITITMAFFTPMRGKIKNLPTDLVPAHAWLTSYVQNRCWEAWKGPEWGNNGQMTSNWGAANIDTWLRKMNPEVALIMFGTNDLGAGPRPPEYTAKMRKIVTACLAHGTIPILYTIPPVARQAGNDKQTQYVETFVDAVRGLAKQQNVPLIDYYKEMLDRQPKDFGAKLLGDGVHPSYPKDHQRDFSPKGLANSGYTLRNYLTLKTYYEVHQQVLSKVKSARKASDEMRWTGPTYKGLPAVLIAKAAAAPKVDGKLDDACWAKAKPLIFRCLDGDTRKPTYPTWAKVVATDKTLCIAFHCADPAMDKLVAQARDRDGPVWSDDCVEVFVKAGIRPTRDYHHIGVNAAGSLFDAFGGKKDWNAKIAVAVAKGKSAWTVELAIPFSQMKLPTNPVRLSAPWRLNLTRARPARAGAFTEETALAPTESSSSHRPAMFAYAAVEALGGKLPKEPPK